MTAAFDTIERHKLIEELAKFIGDDEMRMIRILLSNTEINIENSDTESTPFDTNKGSPQGDAISEFSSLYILRGRYAS